MTNKSYYFGQVNPQDLTTLGAFVSGVESFLGEVLSGNFSNVGHTIRLLGKGNALSGAVMSSYDIYANERQMDAVDWAGIVAGAGMTAAATTYISRFILPVVPGTFKIIAATGITAGVTYLYGSFFEKGVNITIRATADTFSDLFTGNQNVNLELVDPSTNEILGGAYFIDGIADLGNSDPERVLSAVRGMVQDTVAVNDDLDPGEPSFLAMVEGREIVATSASLADLERRYRIFDGEFLEPYANLTNRSVEDVLNDTSLVNYGINPFVPQSIKNNQLYVTKHPQHQEIHARLVGSVDEYFAIKVNVSDNVRGMAGASDIIDYFEDFGAGLGSIQYIDGSQTSFSSTAINGESNLRSGLLVGSDNKDIITAIKGKDNKTLNNYILGGAGNDVITDGLPTNTGPSNDIIDGGDDDDLIRVVRGTDILLGGKGDDIFESLGDGAIIDGGKGIDTASYEELDGGIKFDSITYNAEDNLFAILKQEKGRVDRLISVEQLKLPTKLMKSPSPPAPLMASPSKSTLAPTPPLASNKKARKTFST